jgi:SAM-dependent methyltransferase
MMDIMQQAGNVQATLWNGSSGHAWAETQELLDRMFKPFEDLLVEGICVERGARVLDVGCGAGSTTLAVARCFAGGGQCTGIDISDESGWADISIRPMDALCTVPANELVTYLTRIGPVATALHEADDQLRTRVIRTVLAAFDPYVHGTEVRYTAACWNISAAAASLTARS